MAERSGATEEQVPLMLRVLGPITVERGAEALPAGGPKQRAVLARLAAAEGHMVTADRLVMDLWGEDAPTTILTTLHGYVSRLRAALNDAGLIRRDGPGYSLHLGGAGMEVDARRFEQLAAQGRQASAHDPASALGHFRQALQLWRGPAYAELRDMEWARAAATRLEEARFGVLESSFDAMLQLGEHDAAVAGIESALAENPLRERFTAQLMLALYRGGRQSDALRAYERTRLHLLDELGLDPSPDLVRLESAILAHEGWLAAPAPRVTISSPPPEADATSSTAGKKPASPVALPPAVERQQQRAFVGRQAELESLRKRWRQVLTHQRRFVVIEGEAGSGKSRLAAQFAVEAHAEGAIVLWGRSTNESIVPYEPIVEALRTVMRTISPEARQRMVAGRKGLSMMLPFIGSGDEAVPALSETDGTWADLGTDRYVLFETVVDLLDAESAMWPIVVVLDDLQWADPLSIRLLQHLLLHQRPARVLVIGTIRTAPATDNPPLDSLLGDLRRDIMLKRVTLGGLGEQDVAELLGVDGNPVAASHAAAVHRATRGNPFFVTEIAHQAASGRAGVNELPASVRDVLTERLAKVTANATRLLSVAACAGPTVPLHVLTEASRLGHDEFVDAVDETIAAGLIGEDDATGSVTFRHQLVQQAVMESLTRTRRQHIHIALADALDRAGHSRIEVAHHLHAAGALAHTDRAVTAAVGAGREALARLAYEDALAWADRAREIPGLITPSGSCEILLLRSDAQRALGDRALAREAAMEAADAAREAHDPILLARAAEAIALARSGIGFDFGTTDEGLDRILMEALRGLPDNAVEHRSRLLGASLANAAADSDVRAVRGLSREALMVAQASGQQTLVATAHLASRMSNWNVHMLEHRLETDRLAWEAAQASGSTHLQMNILLYGVSDLTEAGLVYEATDWLGRLRQLAEQVRQPVYDAFVGFMDATRLLLQGEYARSAQLADEALVRGLQSHGVNAEHAWGAQAFIRAWDQGQLAGLAGMVREAAARPPHLPIWLVGDAMCRIAGGQPEEARPILERLVTDDGLQHNPDSVWMAVGSLAAEIARALGDRHRAGILLREMRSCSGRIVVTGVGRASLGPIDRYLGVAAHVAGELDEADRFFVAAIEQARGMGAVPHVARALDDRAHLLSELHGPDDPRVVDSRRRAEKLAARVGLVLDSLCSPVA